MSAGIEYIVEDLSTHPQCAHGPTLLFSRFINDKGDRRAFFACAACRDRKDCSFFLWKDEQEQQQHKVTDYKKQILENEKQKLRPNINHRALFLQLNEVLEISEIKRSFCLTCETFVLPKNKKKHAVADHELRFPISDQELSRPSLFLKPLSNDKKEAQYLFSDSSITTIINILQHLHIKNVLCIGAPRIHEQIQIEHPHMNMTSLLLDLDHRYHSFYGPLQFCWYNLFNHHFFQPNEDVYSDFLRSDKGNGVAVIIDPPFGGRIEPIAVTLNKIQNDYESFNNIQKKLPVFLFFPYFMEPQIKNSLTNYRMVDYKVDYDNHPLFRKGSKGRKFGSPVRIFTNISLNKIQLPETDGYRYCSSCRRWIYKENKHCEECNDCTSKDGRTYIHCALCKRCVKPTWMHCEKCEKCAQPDHKCGDIPFTQSCFHCKERGHKKNNCPKVNHENLQNKRQSKVENKKKRKRT